MNGRNTKFKGIHAEPDWTASGEPVSVLLGLRNPRADLTTEERNAFALLQRELSGLTFRWIVLGTTRAAHIDPDDTGDINLDFLASGRICDELIEAVGRLPPEAQQPAAQLRMLVDRWFTRQQVGPALARVMPQLTLAASM